MDGDVDVPDASGAGESSAYIDPGTDFLRNEVSATTQEEIDDASAELLPERLEDLADLAAENLLRGLSREQFIGQLAQFYARLNYIHPFREGNGRTQRLFWGQVALHAGWTVDFVGMSKTANDGASRDASQDLGLEPLIAVLDEVTSPAPSVEQGEEDLVTSVRRKRRGRNFLGWIRSHANPDRA